MRKQLIILAVLLLPFLAFAQVKTLVIRNISVIDVKTGVVHKAQTILIEGDKIAAVGTKLTIPKGAASIDATGKYLMPGLWDMHAHTLSDHRYTYVFPLLLANGITGVREMGNNLSIEEVNNIVNDAVEAKS